MGKEGRRKQEERSIGDGSEKGKELERYDRREERSCKETREKKRRGREKNEGMRLSILLNNYSIYVLYILYAYLTLSYY